MSKITFEKRRTFTNVVFLKCLVIFRISGKVCGVYGKGVPGREYSSFSVKDSLRGLPLTPRRHSRRRVYT